MMRKVTMAMQRDMLRARFAVIVCMTALASFSMACSTTNPDEEVDLALSGDAPDAGAETERLTAEAASAESDYSSTEPAAEAVPAPASDASTMPPNDPFVADQQSGQSGQTEEVTGAESAALAAPAAPEESAAAPSEGEVTDSTATEGATADSTTDAGVTDGSSAESAPAEVAAATEELATESPAEPVVLDAVPPAPNFATDGGVAGATAAATTTATTAATGGEDPYLQDASATASVTDAGTFTDAAAAAPETVDPYAGVTDPFAAAAIPAEIEDTRPAERAPDRKGARAPVRNASRSIQASIETASQSLSYLVAPGDTLSEIAQRIYGSVREWRTVAQANGLEAPHRIYPGDVLSIPTFGAAAAFAQAYNNAPETTVTVQRGDTLFSISQRLLGDGSAWKYIWKINEADIPNPDRLTPGQTIRFRDFRGIQAGM